MSITASLLSFGLRHVLDVSADQLIATIEKRLTDHSQALPKALARANDRAWVAVGLALAGDSWFDRIKDVFRDGDMRGVRDQIKTFLAQTPTGLESTTGAVRAKATEEWLRLRKSKKLVAETIHLADLARRTASIQRHGDPAGMTAAAHRVVADTANALKADFPHLAELLIAAPTGGSPLLVSAFAFFFRRELETNSELAHGLSFDFLYQISAQQERGFALLDVRTEGILDQFGLLFDSLEVWFGRMFAELAEIRRDQLRWQEANKVPVTTVENPIVVSASSEREQRQMRAIRDRIRGIPSELLAVSDLDQLGDNLDACGLFEEALAARQLAAEKAKAEADRKTEADSLFKAYKDACETGRWAEGKEALTRAVRLDGRRFRPFDTSRYRLDAILGVGGFGTVFKCQDTEDVDDDGNPIMVAIKSLRRDTLDRDPRVVFSEARTLRDLHRPDSRIIRVVNWGYAFTDPDDPDRKERPYIVMEFFPGETLHDIVSREGPLGVQDFLAVTRQIAEALLEAHGKKIFHRDLKPANIMARRLVDGTWDVRVIDFGLAVRHASAHRASLDRAAGRDTKENRSLTGSLDFAPPEQRGKLPGVTIGSYSDVYAFAKTCQWLLFRTTEPLHLAHWKRIPEPYRDPLRKLITEATLPDVVPSPDFGDETPLRTRDFGVVLAALTALDPSERVNRERLEREAAERAQAEATRAAEKRARKNAEQAERLKREQEEAERKRQVADAEVKRQQEEARRRAEDEARGKAEEEAKTKDPFHKGRVRSAGDTLRLKLPGDVPITFAWCPPGSFQMGSEHPEAMKEDWCKKTERPVHNVTLTKGFFMGIHPVTQAQWKAVIGTEPSHFKGPNRPVEQVSWGDCQEFCQKLTGLLKGKATVHLPTEAEWEYACRAGTTTEFWFGDVINPDLANYDGKHQWNGSPKGKYREQTTDVGTVGSKNPWGLFDLHGNVWEWCQDAWDEAHYSKSPGKDPICTNDQITARVLRGGSWYYIPDYCRSAFRFRRGRDNRSNYLGCRVCFRLDG